MRTLILCLVLASLTARAQENPAIHPHQEMNNWGKWGADDERGATNYITPQTIIDAAKLIRKGKVFSLAIPIERSGPIFPTRNPPHHFMSATGTDALHGPTPNSPDVAFTDDYIHMPLQGSTQWDGLPHAFYGGRFYNDVPLEAVTASGAQRLGMENVRDRFVGRAVLIDIVAYKGGSIEPGYGITRADIEGALKKQKTKIRSGDIVLLRTGAVPYFYTMPAAERSKWVGLQTGITKDVVPWIRDSQIAAIAADNLGVEQAPNAHGKNWNLHGNLLRDLGVFLGEIWWLEDLAKDCAEDGRYEFFLSAQPLYIPGAVGSPLNPMAIK